MSTPSISVVIATWQRPALLYRCLLALIDQSLPPVAYEMIVVTDGPDPASLQCITRVQAAHPHAVIRPLSLPHKKGPAAARNVGWKAALAGLVVFTDDDCLPDHFFLENYWNAHQWVGKPLLAFAGKVEVPLPPVPSDYEKNVAKLEDARFVTANCACTIHTLREVGGLDESFTMAWREDSALEFACTEKQIPVIAVPAAIVAHPVRPAPWGISLREQKKTMFNALLYRKYPRLYQQHINNKPPWYYYAMVALATTTIIGLAGGVAYTWVPALCWLLLAAWFTGKRLQGTSKTRRHVTEMVYTSILIPFVSIYWNCYGAVKFKTFLL